MKKIMAFASLGLIIMLLGTFSIFQYKKIKESGQYNLSILKNDVNVHFDTFGIPHIEAGNSDDAYRVLGFIMAGERLFQMDLLRRLINGKLSEVFGEKTLKADILLRKLRFKKSAEEYLNMNLNSFNPKMLSQLTSFLEGIHYFMDNNSLPLEFNLLGYTPEKFEISDIVGLSGYMAMTFAEGLTGDILISELMEKLPEEKMNIIRTGSDTDNDYFSQQKIVKSNFLKGLHQSIDEISKYLPLFHGSNSWVLSGERTTSGKPILANDPHIAVSNPHIFYEAHIKYPDFEFYGEFIPLSPLGIMGHTPYSAWGITMAVIDDLTVYLEKVNPQNPNQVMFKNEWVELKKNKEFIKVKNGKIKEIEIAVTPHGPLLDGTKYGVDGKFLSLSWSVYHPQNHVLQSLYELPRAKTITEFRKAVSHAGAPGLNISWVNKEGDIAWWALGKNPKLPEGVPYDIVLKGWDGTQEIERYYSIDENPHQINPESGIIVSANYKPQLREFDHLDGYWQPAGRYFRLEKLLKKKNKWSLEDLKLIQTDNTVPIFNKVRKQLLSGVDKTKLTDYEKKALKYYEDWDGLSTRSKVGASIYNMWNYYLAFNVFSDELGVAGFEKFGRTADFWHAFKKLLFNQSHSFWDNVTTNHVESGAEIITSSFKQSVVELEKRLGRRMDRWKWGRLHKATYVHPLGRIKPLDLIYNIGPIEANGGRYVINNLGHKKYTNDFSVVHAPATRRLIDMANPRISYGIIPTGNSGNPFSEHFSDQLKLYHQGEYRIQNMDWSLIQKYPILLFRSDK